MPSTGPEVVLVRHGETEWSAALKHTGTTDMPLTAAGREQARAVGRALARLDVEVDACVSSPKRRAVQTARLACEPFGVEPKEDDRLAGGPFDPREVAGHLGDDVLLVGHDPDFSLAVNNMTGAQVRLEKAALAGVDRGELKVLLRPSELEALAGSS